METNVFFSAVQSALDAHIKRMVEEAVTPLLERIAALENNPAQGQDLTLMRDVAAEVNKVVDSEDFWHRIGNYVTEQVGNTVEAKIEEAMDNHCETYNHDDYDALHNEWGGESVDDFVKDGYIEEQIDDRVHETLRNASFSISI